jgi:hypothetical protein
MGDIAKDVEDVNKGFSKMETWLNKLTASVGKFSEALGKGFKGTGIGTNGGTGQTGLGSSGRSQQPTSFGNVPQFLAMNQRTNMAGTALMGGIQAGTSLLGGMVGALPDVQSTQARSIGFYNAGIMTGGGMNRTTVTNQMMRFMKGGITSEGGVPIGDVQTANIFAGAGVQMGGGANSQFGKLATSVGNAAKYLNVDNATAAKSMVGLTQGGMSSNLMRNFGIYTTDPATGRRKSPTETYKEIASRITGGQRLTTRELQDSMQGGALAVNLSQIGDQFTQDMVYQTLLNNAPDATGKGKLDLTNSSSMDAYGKAMGLNPNDPQLRADTAQAQTMNAASDAYIEGLKKAAGVVEEFNKAIQGFLGTAAGQGAAQLNAGASMLMNAPGMGSMASGIMGALGAGAMIGGQMLTNNALARTMAKNGLGDGGAAGATAGGAGAAGTKPTGAKWKAGGKGGGGQWVDEKSGKPLTQKQIAARSGGGAKVNGKASLGKALAKGAKGGLLGLAVGVAGSFIGDSIAAGSEVGSDQSKLGNAVGTAATWGGMGAMVGSIIPGVGTGIGAALGAAAGGIYGWMTGGETNTVGTGSTSGPAGAFKLVQPVPKGSKVSAGWGHNKGAHKGRGHKGIDYAVAPGTPIMAAADGKVTRAGGNSKNTYGSNDRSFGLNVRVDHGNGYVTIYAHLSSTQVAVGTEVKAGNVIAKSGNSGYSTGPHLHFQLEYKGSPVDPSKFLNGNYATPTGDFGEQGDSSAGVNPAAPSAGSLGFNDGSVSKPSALSVPGAYSGSGSGGAGGGYAMASGSTKGNVNAASSSGLGTANVGNGMGGDGPAPGGNNVVINVTVAQASESEARRFANLIKQYIDDDSLMSNMGRL